MAGKKSDLGPSGRAVANNVHRVRELRRLNFADLSRRLAKMGREIPPLGLRRIEAGERRVDADDLTALALALGVTPATLLMPYVAKDDIAVEVTGVAEPVPAVNAWNWLVARDEIDYDTLPDSAGSDEAAAKFFRWMTWASETHPDWMVGNLADAARRGLSEDRARAVFETGYPTSRLGHKRSE